MAKPFLLRLLTPYQSLFEGDVDAVIVPGEHGEFGVLAQHTKFVTTLKPGIWPTPWSFPGTSTSTGPKSPATGRKKSSRIAPA